MIDFSLIDPKKALLDSLRPLPAALVKNLDEVFKVEFTYSSNAIEGNTLTKSETALVIEKGITIGGKSLKEHLEAINHGHAIDYIEGLAQKTKKEIQLTTILDIQRLILKGIDDAHAGRLRTVAVRISGSDVTFPLAVKVPELMEEYISWLHQTKEHPVKIAADAHFKLVFIHPFVDGNGRTARLIMNLLLMQAGYPPAIIRKEDRLCYINALEKAHATQDLSDFYQIIFNAVNHSLDLYIAAAEQSE